MKYKEARKHIQRAFDLEVDPKVLRNSLQVVETEIASHIEDADLLGEAYAMVQSIYDPAKAYLYYQLQHSQEGYSLGWCNEHEDPDVYCGPVGDFRNESMVSGLMDILGFQRSQAIDKTAREWLRDNGFQFQISAPSR